MKHGFALLLALALNALIIYVIVIHIKDPSVQDCAFLLYALFGIPVAAMAGGLPAYGLFWRSK